MIVDIRSYRQGRVEDGFLLIQMILALVIVGILATTIFVSLSSGREKQALANAVEETLSAFSEARSRTIAGENNTQYGVHIGSSSVTIFQGSSYSSGASTNRVVSLDNAVTITSISLSGGGSDVIFSRLTGDTTQYGTLVVKRSSTTAGQKTITIGKTGIASSN